MKVDARKLGPLVGLVLFGVALTILHRELRHTSYQQILAGLQAIPVGRRLAAVGLTGLSYLLFSGYDLLALRYIGKRLALARVAITSFLANAMAINLGFAMLSSAPVRYRLYSGLGLSAVDVAKVVVFASVSIWTGFLLLAGSTFAGLPAAIPAELHVPLATTRPLGFAFLTAVVTYLVLAAFRRAPIRVGQWELALPSLRLALGQTVVSSLDWAVAGAVLFVLLPTGAGLSYPSFLAAFLLAQVAGVLSQVPGGLGIFETVLLLLLRGRLSQAELLGAMLAYRGIYYLLPLMLAAVTLGALEAAERRRTMSRVARLLVRWTGSLTPVVLAFTTFLGGTILLVSGSTPAIGSRIAWLGRVLPLPVLEVSHFLGSLVGVGLLLLAWGLVRRLDVAWHLSVLLLAAGAVFSLLKGLDWEEATVLTGMLAALLPARRVFYRTSSLLAEPFAAGWIAAVLVVVAGSTWLGFFAERHVEYSSELWWQFALKGDAPRFLRATVGVLAMLAAVAVVRLMRPASVERGEVTQEDRERIRALVEASPVTSANLAFLEDKSFIMSEQRDAFIMYGVEGKTWVAMGDPIGAEGSRKELVWRFRQLSDAHGGWTAFYEVRPSNLHLYLDLGLSLLKLGEEARVPINSFSLEGGERKALRYVMRRFQRDGWEFSMIPRDDVGLVLPRLRQISDAWLTERSTREKRFSMGRFDEGYLANFPVGVVRREDEIVAFANLWLGGDNEELSVDLMRHAPEAPNSVMDFLFSSLILWGRGEGYRWFNLGMAPLAGLENRSLAPLWNRVGSLLFTQGERIYHFRGLQAFKEKFDPVWEPRYLAAPGGLALPVILTNIAALNAGGMRGVIAR